MSVGSEMHTAGSEVEGAGMDTMTPDRQGLMLAELVGFMTKDTPSVQHVLDLTGPHLRDIAGLTAATVFELDSETGMMTASAQLGEPGRRDQLVAGKVFRAPAGGKPVVNGEQMAIRLRIGGQTVGVLLLTGSHLAELQLDTISTMALHFATTLQGLAAEKQRQFVAHSSATIQELFEQGMTAGNMETAAELLARQFATAFRTEHAAMHLIDGEGKVRYVHGVGFSDDIHQALSTNMLGRLASESPVWRSVAESGEPVLVGDASTAKTRAGGFVQTIGVRSFIAMPLMSGQGPVGMVMCGDSTGTRDWSARDRLLAQQLAVEGALIMDSARMRQAAEVHMNELHRQAFHDSLTGLPNRKQLLDRAEVAVEIAAATGTRVALLLLDLNGFKQVNDTVGHHAGDVLLQLVAKRLQGVVRRPDLVARLGGDEFSVLLTCDPDAEDAIGVGERICERLREPFDIEGEPVRIGASIGVALFPEHGTEFAGLMRDADAYMYQAKRGGGGVRLAGS
ncbi:sensor domain-containing diguanylate cyclase [Actinoplanes sp. NEAU-A12]|uniref:Sensor domain-containing diguanylate cyclase n=2 Tax=Actinoplanes sandaracinus TaxID=3045177 RepID=A0ABT6WN28_9ACTN|nr:sensor domain-containing diguanylate cyclase [Actinoplanes sandaracinus]